MSIRYARLLDGHDWNAHAYPSGAFCVVMVEDDDGNIVNDITLEEFYTSYPQFDHGTFWTTLGMVYSVDGEPMNPVLVDPKSEYGTLYNSVEDLIENIPTQARVEERVREEMNENLIARDLAREARTLRFQRALLVAAVILAIVISYFYLR